MLKRRALATTAYSQPPAADWRCLYGFMNLVNIRQVECLGGIAVPPPPPPGNKDQAVRSIRRKTAMTPTTPP